MRCFKPSDLPKEPTDQEIFERKIGKVFAYMRHNAETLTRDKYLVIPIDAKRSVLTLIALELQKCGWEHIGVGWFEITVALDNWHLEFAIAGDRYKDGFSSFIQYGVSRGSTLLGKRL